MKNFCFLLLLCLTLNAGAQFPHPDTSYFFLFGGEQTEEFRDLDNVSADSGYIALGTTSSFSNGFGDLYLVHSDWKGNTVWSRSIGSPNIEKGYAVKETPDGGFILGGFTNNSPGGDYDMYVVKTDSEGFVIWEKHFGGADWDFLYSIALTPDSGFLLCGESYSFGNTGGDVYVVRTDKNGTVLWEKTYGGNAKDVGHKIILTADSNFAVAGYTESFGSGMRDGYFLKGKLTDGDTLFTKVYGDSLNEEFLSLAENKTYKGFILVGYDESYNSTGNKDVFYVGFDSTGTVINNFYVSFGSAGDDGLTSVVSYGSYFFVSGYTANGGGVFDLQGGLVHESGWYQFQYSGSFGGFQADYGWAAVMSKREDFVMAGSTQSFNASNTDALLVLNDSMRCCQKQSVKISSDTLVFVQQYAVSGFGIYPNPAKGLVTIKTEKPVESIEITDITGKTLYYCHPVFSAGTNVADLSHFAPGVYFIRASFKSGYYSGKIIVGEK
jgi:hypothetical protein